MWRLSACRCFSGSQCDTQEYFGVNAEHFILNNYDVATCANAPTNTQSLNSMPRPADAVCNLKACLVFVEYDCIRSF